MKNPIKKLQTNLAKDLVKMENTSLDEKKQKMITKAYNSVYKIISSADKKPK